MSGSSEVPIPEFETPAPPRAALAGRGERLIAALIDAAINLVPTLAASWWLGLYDEFQRTGQVAFGDQLAASVLGIVFYLAINGSFIYSSGQTLGKKILKIVVVNLDDDEPVDGNRYVFLRLAPMWVAGVIPIVGPLISLLNPLFIFGSARRCLHDYIAGTRVIKA